MTSRKSLCLGGWVLLGLMIFIGCSSDDDPVAPPATGAKATIGTAGGTLEIPGGLAMTVPADALTGDIDFAADVNPSPPAGPTDFILLSPVYSIEPSGTDFAETTLLQMNYSEALLAGASEGDIVIFTHTGIGWEELRCMVFPDDNLVEAGISHLSDFVVAVPMPVEPDPIYAQLVVHRQITAEDILKFEKIPVFIMADQLFAQFTTVDDGKPSNPLQAESVAFGEWDLEWGMNAYGYSNSTTPAFLTLGETYDFVVVGSEEVPSLTLPVPIMEVAPYVTNLTADQAADLAGFTLEWSGSAPTGSVDFQMRGLDNTRLDYSVPNTGSYTFSGAELSGLPAGTGSISLNLVGEIPIVADGYVASSRVRLTSSHSTDVVFTSEAVIEDVTVVSTPNLAIPDATSGGYGNPVTDIINAPVTGAVDSVRVYLDISHDYMSDLIVRLTSPDGTELRVLFIGEGGEHDGRIQGWYPGDFVPKDDLNGFDGENAGGDWTLTARDYSQGVAGTLNEWRVQIFYTQ